MIISNITPPQVWSSSSRSLTNFGSGALAVGNSLNQTLAAASSISLKTSAGIVGQTTVGVLTGAGATVASNVSLNDNTNNFIAAITAASGGASVSFTFVNTNTCGPQVFNNDVTHAATWAQSSYLMTI